MHVGFIWARHLDDAADRDRWRDVFVLYVSAIFRLSCIQASMLLGG